MFPKTKTLRNELLSAIDVILFITNLFTVSLSLPTLNVYTGAYVKLYDLYFSNNNNILDFVDIT